MRRYKWNDERIQVAVEQYAAGEAIQRIAEDMGVSSANVAQVLKEKGVWKRRQANLTTEQWSEAVRAYKDGELVKDIAKKLHKHPATLSSRLVREVGKREKKYAGRRKYRVNEIYFDEIATEKQAYWLGFLAADGTIVLKDHVGVVAMSLQFRDKDILEKFKRDLESEHPLSKTRKVVGGKVYRGWRIDIGSIRMARRLYEIGVIPNKTRRLDWAKVVKDLPPQLVRHFIRGYSDGDGCWYYNKKHGLQWSIVSGSRKFVSGLKQHLVAQVGLGDVKIHRRKKNHLVQWCGDIQLARVYHYLYDEAIVYMERKQLKAEVGLNGMRQNTAV